MRDKIQRLYPRPLDVLELSAIVGIVGLVIVRALVGSDLSFWDEAAYLNRGLSQTIEERATFTDGALYSDMYLLLSKFISDHSTLFFAGRALSAVLVVVGVWVATRILSNRIFAISAAALIAATPAPYVWPGVSAPAAASVAIAVAVIIRLPGIRGVSLATGLFWLGAAARPELVPVAAIGSAVCVGWLGWLSRNSQERTGISRGAVATLFIGAIAIPAALICAHGSPIDTTNRSWTAFVQHFALRHAQLGEDPWLDASAIASRYFGNATSVIEAARNEPLAFLGHLYANLRSSPHEFLYNVLSWPSPQAIAFIVISGLGISLSLLLAPRTTLLKLRSLGGKVLQPKYRVSTLMTFLLLVALAEPIVIIYPRDHYLLLPLTVILPLILAIQFRVGLRRMASLTPALLSLILLVTLLLHTAGLAIEKSSQPTSLASAVESLKQDDRQWRMLGIDWGLEVFVPGLVQVSDDAPENGETFREFIKRQRINLMLVNDRFSNATWSKAIGFDASEKGLRELGFKPLAADRSDLWILE